MGCASRGKASKKRRRSSCRSVWRLSSCVHVLALVAGRQLAVDQQVRHLEEVRVLAELLDRVAAVAHDPGVAVDEGDRAPRHGRVREAVVQRGHAGVPEQVADVNPPLVLRALLDPQRQLLAVDRESSFPDPEVCRLGHHVLTRSWERPPGSPATRHRRRFGSSRRTSGRASWPARRTRRGPSTSSGLEHLRRDARTGRGDLQAEERVADHRDAVEPAFEGRVDHRARVRDVHALADAVRAAGPAGVDEPVGRRGARSARRAASRRRRGGGA